MRKPAEVIDRHASLTSTVEKAELVKWVGIDEMILKIEMYDSMPAFWAVAQRNLSGEVEHCRAKLRAWFWLLGDEFGPDIEGIEFEMQLRFLAKERGWDDSQWRVA